MIYPRAFSSMFLVVRSLETCESNFEKLQEILNGTSLKNISAECCRYFLEYLLTITADTM